MILSVLSCQALGQLMGAGPAVMEAAKAVDTVVKEVGGTIAERVGIPREAWEALIALALGYGMHKNGRRVEKKSNGTETVALAAQLKAAQGALLAEAAAKSMGKSSGENTPR